MIGGGAGLRARPATQPDRTGYQSPWILFGNGDRFSRQAKTLELQEAVIAPRSPWQNAYAERVIGSIRRECLDHVVVIGERHLREILLKYVDYYNRTRTHLSERKTHPNSGRARAGWLRCRASAGSITNTYNGRRESIGRISRRHRFVHSIREECLDRLILFGERRLRHVIGEFVAHYHGERNHRGLGND